MRTFLDVTSQKAIKACPGKGQWLSHSESGHAVPFLQRTSAVRVILLITSTTPLTVLARVRIKLQLFLPGLVAWFCFKTPSQCCDSLLGAWHRFHTTSFLWLVPTQGHTHWGGHTLGPKWWCLLVPGPGPTAKLSPAMGPTQDGHLHYAEYGPA